MTGGRPTSIVYRVLYDQTVTNERTARGRPRLKARAKSSKRPASSSSSSSSAFSHLSPVVSSYIAATGTVPPAPFAPPAAHDDSTIAGRLYKDVGGPRSVRVHRSGTAPSSPPSRPYSATTKTMMTTTAPRTRPTFRSTVSRPNTDAARDAALLYRSPGQAPSPSPSMSVYGGGVPLETALARNAVARPVFGDAATTRSGARTAGTVGTAGYVGHASGAVATGGGVGVVGGGAVGGGGLGEAGVTRPARGLAARTRSGAGGAGVGAGAVSGYTKGAVVKSDIMFSRIMGGGDVCGHAGRGGYGGGGGGGAVAGAGVGSIVERSAGAGAGRAGAMGVPGTKTWGGERVDGGFSPISAPAAPLSAPAAPASTPATHASPAAASTAFDRFIMRTSSPRRSPSPFAIPSSTPSVTSETGDAMDNETAEVPEGGGSATAVAVAAAAHLATISPTDAWSNGPIEAAAAVAAAAGAAAAHGHEPPMMSPGSPVTPVRERRIGSPEEQTRDERRFPSWFDDDKEEGDDDASPRDVRSDDDGAGDAAAETATATLGGEGGGDPVDRLGRIERGITNAEEEEEEEEWAREGDDDRGHHRRSYSSPPPPPSSSSRQEVVHSFLFFFSFIRST